jgi:pilus assembly protein Flp/PilA
MDGLKTFFCRKGFEMNTVKRFIKDEQGLETVEWAVIAALIVAGLIAIITGLGQNVEGRFAELQNATAPTP